MITLVTGGSGSGKSAYAESLLYSCEGIRDYIATMQIYDAEGEKKVERHRKLRAGKGFLTIESPMNVGKIQFGCAGESGQAQYRQEAERKGQCSSEKKSALLECMSNLVANEMFPPVDASGMQAAEAEKEALDDPENMKDYDTAQISRVSKKVLKEVSILSENVAELVIVTNNVFEDGVSYDQSTMNYIKAMGIVNRGLAAMAERVVEVVAGIPVAVK